MSYLNLAYLFAIAFLAASACAQVTMAHLASRDLGWAVVDSHVFVTTNEGSTWSDITPPHGNAEFISDVHFMSRTSGSVSLLSAPSGDQSDLEDDIVIASTGDGGQTWTRAVIPRSRISTVPNCCFGAALDFVDAEDGWLMARLASSPNFSAGSLFATNDSGKSWHALPDPPIGDPPYFVTKDLGWLAGGAAGMDLWRTVDGALTWQAVTIPYVEHSCAINCRPQYQAPLFSDPLHGRLTVTLLKNEDTVVLDLVTADGGSSWSLSPQAAGSGGDLLGFSGSTQTAGATVHVKLDDKGLIDLVSHGLHQRTRAGSQGTKSLANDSVSLAGFVSDSEGWLIYSAEACEPSHPTISRRCPAVTQLLVTHDGGRFYDSVTPKVSRQPTPAPVPRGSLSPQSSTTPAPPAPGPPFSSPLIGVSYQEQGFDVACAPTTTLMSAWWNYSPFYDFAVYVGGVWASCPVAKNYNLSSVWSQASSATGWGLMPVWIGLQAPLSCSPIKPFSQTNSPSTTLIDSTSSANAYAEGFSEGQAAFASAQGFGLTGIVYKDIEQYSVAPCPPIQYFLEGWGNALHGLGIEAGVYMSYSDNADYNAPRSSVTAR